MKSQKEIIEALRSKTSGPEKSNVASAVLHAFAVRQRTRNRIMVSILSSSMKKEGFEFSIKEYRDFLKFLSDLGIGTLMFHTNGHIKGLTEIRYTLQSLGMAALGQTGETKEFSPKNKYRKLPTVSQSPRVSIGPNLRLGLTVQINGKMLNIPVSNDLTPEEIGILLNKLKAA